MIKFRQMLCERDFSETLNTDCPVSAYNKCISVFKNIFNEPFPLLETRIYNKNTKYEPWVSNSFLTSSSYSKRNSGN